MICVNLRDENYFHWKFLLRFSQLYDLWILDELENVNFCRVLAWCDFWLRMKEFPCGLVVKVTSENEKTMMVFTSFVCTSQKINLKNLLFLKSQEPLIHCIVIFATKIHQNYNFFKIMSFFTTSPHKSQLKLQLSWKKNTRDIIHA